MSKAVFAILTVLATAIVVAVLFGTGLLAPGPFPGTRRDSTGAQTVATGAEPTPSPQPPPECSTRLQALVDAAEPGSTVLVPTCLYRETVRVSKPLTLDGQGWAEVRGSDVWTGWNRVGQFWIKGPVPLLHTDANPDQCQPNTANRCLHAEQVFLNGRPLTWVASSPRVGQFTLDWARNVLLADDPTGRTVEVTTRQRWADIQADNVTIRRFTMRHIASAPNVTTALGNQGTSGFTVEDNVLSDAHGSVLSIDGGSGARVLRNDISRGGQLGVSGWKASGALVQSNKIHDNAIDGFDSEWAAGGLKMIGMVNLTVDGNEVWSNSGPGLWCDIACSNVTISNNHIHDNPGNAIFFEISDGASIYGNTIWDSGGWASIAISSSGNAEVHNNTISRSPSIHVLRDNRADAPSTAGENLRIYDNAAP